MRRPSSQSSYRPLNEVTLPNHQNEDKQFYVSTDVYRAYWLLSKVHDDMMPGNSGLRRVTPDELADCILRKHIEDNYPQLFTHQKEVDSLEKTLIEKLKKKPT